MMKIPKIVSISILLIIELVKERVTMTFSLKKARKSFKNFLINLNF